MTAVNMHDAKTHFSRLINRVEAGEEVIIARAGKPVAKVVPISPEPKPVKREGGWLKGYTVPDDWKGNGWREELEDMFFDNAKYR